MAEKIAKAGITREKGFLYYLDKEGDVAMAKMARAGEKSSAPKKLVKTGVTRESGYLYFIDKEGDVARTPMARGGKAVKAKKK
jgi:hypothetical protein